MKKWRPPPLFVEAIPYINKIVEKNLALAAPARLALAAPAWLSLPQLRCGLTVERCETAPPHAVWRAGSVA